MPRDSLEDLMLKYIRRHESRLKIRCNNKWREEWRAKDLHDDDDDNHDCVT